MNRRLFVIAIVFIVSWWLAVTAGTSQTTASATESKSPKTRVIGRRLREKGVPNFGEVTPTLYRGGLLNTAGLRALAKMGINVVVDTHANDESEEKKFLKVLHENQGKKVFVHCRLGDDRTGMMVAAYRMADEGWSADEAMNEMREFGFTRPHHLICPGLARYEKHFPEHLKENAAFKGVRSKK
jgi:protein tyrosine phosphatase (PTP) superfamily phosphohydrolase (DUF442 family)